VLYVLAKYCEFGDTLPIMLRDGLVCGVNHEGIQRQLLAEKNLIYKIAHELALNLEAEAKGNKDISSQQTSQQTEPIVNYTKGMKQRSGKTTHPRAIKPSDGKLTCYHCGASQCKFCTAECHRWHKTGHNVKVCNSRPDAKSHHSGKRANHYLEEIPDLPDTEDPTYGLFTLQSKTHDPIVVQLELNSVPIRMELDSGASLTLINKASYT